MILNVSQIRLGISRCLLGDQVRYDGGHRRNAFLVEVLGNVVEWVPVCPEVEAGFGTPREPMRLVRGPRDPRLVTISTNRDLTRPLKDFSRCKNTLLGALDLSGYVFKKNSPSCGIEQVPVYNRSGRVTPNGIGLFARSFQEHFPLIPITDEDRLTDQELRDNFLERVFCYHRWKTLARGPVTRKAVVEFHTLHKYLLLAHSRRHYQQLGRLLASADRDRPKDLIERYGILFMKAVAVTATVRKHVHVLQHILGRFKDRLGAQEKAELAGVIGDYHRGRTPLIVPLTLIKHYVQIFDIGYIRDQVYLNPHPKELVLRNHV